MPTDTDVREVPDDVKRRAIAHSCAFADPTIQAFVESRIISAIMADRTARATREAAKAEARREALEEARAIMRKAWDDGPGSVPGDKVTLGMAASAFSTAQIAIAAAIRAKAEE